MHKSGIKQHIGTVALFCAVVCGLISAVVATCSWEEVLVRSLLGAAAGGLLAWIVFSFMDELARQAARTKKSTMVNPLTKDIVDEVKRDAAAQDINPQDAAKVVSRMLQ